MCARVCVCVCMCVRVGVATRPIAIILCQRNHLSKILRRSATALGLLMGQSCHIGKCRIGAMWYFGVSQCVTMHLGAIRRLVVTPRYPSAAFIQQQAVISRCVRSNTCAILCCYQPSFRVNNYAAGRIFWASLSRWANARQFYYPLDLPLFTTPSTRLNFVRLQ